MMNFKEFWTKKTLIGLGLGQVLSLLITATGFASNDLAKRGTVVFAYVKSSAFCYLSPKLSSIALDYWSYNSQGWQGHYVRDDWHRKE